jgi:hypothetical protein
VLCDESVRRSAQDDDFFGEFWMGFSPRISANFPDQGAFL